MFLFVLMFVLNILFLVLSVVIHEASHLIAMYLLGIKPQKPDIKLFCIPKDFDSPMGYIDSINHVWTGPDVSESEMKKKIFIFGFSGGFGLFIVFFLFSLFLFYFSSIFFIFLGLPLLTNAIVQLCYGFYEGWYLQDQLNFK